MGTIFRAVLPASVDRASLLCNIFLRTGYRCLCEQASSTTVKECGENVNTYGKAKSFEDAEPNEVNPLFLNRNPRALEFMGLEPKRKGWKYQAPRKDFYHRLLYNKDQTYACIEHCSGTVVIEASSKEPAVAKHLYNLNDVSANWNVGRLLARRMLEAGITSVFYEADHDGSEASSEKERAFMSALKDGEIKLHEPSEVQHEHIPGINYAGYNRLNEPRRYKEDYQKLDYNPRKNFKESNQPKFSVVDDSDMPGKTSAEISNQTEKTDDKS